jgi:hypothetical protein
MAAGHEDRSAAHIDGSVTTPRRSSAAADPPELDVLLPDVRSVVIGSSTSPCRPPVPAYAPMSAFDGRLGAER